MQPTVAVLPPSATSLIALSEPRVTERSSAASGRWLRSPVHDLTMAFVWVPFVVATHVVTNNPDRLRR